MDRPGKSQVGLGCLAENTVVAFLQGELVGNAADDVEKHVDGCPECRELLAAMAAGASSPPTVPAHAAALAPTVLLDSPSGPIAPTAITPGTHVGRYVILETIGVGGMGVVYAARDPELDRKVALKLLRADLAWPGLAGDLRTRLLREAQAIARLSHPNVISVYDAGTFEGQVFVAMELVDGRTLSAWRQETPRTWREVLHMFRFAGRGLAAAHAAGLVHRDFKPENVLVDAGGRVRVLDFGLARPIGTAEAANPAAAAAASVDTTLTRTGVLVGTPAYMAPEQFAGEPTEERTDQFSFCVALYEGLYGERPFPGRTLAELALEVPSGHVREAPAGSPVPLWLRRVILRGLAPRPIDRFASMHELLEALQRDPRARWRRLGVAVAAAAALVAVGGAGWHNLGARWPVPCQGSERKLAGVWDAGRRQAIRDAFAATGKPFAPDAAERALRVIDQYAQSWTAMHQGACEATQRGEQSHELLDLRMECLGRRLQDVDALSGLLARADGEVVTKAVEAAHGLQSLAGCADAPALRSRVRPPADPAVRARVDGVHKQIAELKALRDAGKFRAALDLAQQAARSARELGYRPAQGEAVYYQGELEERVGNDGLAEKLLREAALAAEAGGNDEVRAHALLHLVYLVGYKLARFEEAQSITAQAAVAIERVGANEELEARLENTLGNIALAEQKFDQALDHYRRALALFEHKGPDDPYVATSFDDIGLVLAERGELELALEYHRRGLTIREKVLGPDHPDVATSLNNISGVLWQQGKYDEALALFRRVMTLQEKVWGPVHADIADSLNNIGMVESDKGDVDESLATLRRALAMYERTLGPANPKTAMCHSNIGNTLRLMPGRLEASRAELQRALAIFEKAMGGESRDVAMCLHNLADTERARHRLGEALALHRRSLAIYEKSVGPEHPEVPTVLTGLGEDLVELHRPAEAIAPLERALALRTAKPGAPADLADTRYALARALWDGGGDRARARQLMQDARAFSAESGKKEDVREADAWLKKHPH